MCIIRQSGQLTNFSLVLVTHVLECGCLDVTSSESRASPCMALPSEVLTWKIMNPTVNLVLNHQRLWNQECLANVCLWTCVQALMWY